jgi:cellulose synthase (UDP-forming)
MDESCITEDFATSFRLHTQGYRGVYVDRIYAEGVAPPTLSAYYTQQLRWAYGTTQHMGRVVRTLLSRPRALTPHQWFDFMGIGTSYLLGIVNLVMLLFPSVILLWNVKLVSMNLPTIFFPFFLLVMALQLTTSIKERHYRLLDLLRAQAILNSVSLVYAQAIFFLWCGKKLTFRVTPKTIGRGDNGQSAKLMPPVLAMLGVIAFSIGIGVSRILSGSTNTNLPYALFWACYGFTILASYVLVYRGDTRKTLDAVTNPTPDIPVRLERQGIED